MSKQIRCIWIFLICIAVVFTVKDWYNDHYCKNTAIPALCTKQ